MFRHLLNRFCLPIICFFLLPVKALQAQVADAGQRVIRINITNQPISTALKTLERGAKVRFNYASGLVRSGDLVSISRENAKLDDVLGELLAPREISWRYEGSNVILRRRVKEGNRATEEKGNAQVVEIYGTVTDTSGKPLEGVSIGVKGSNAGTMTNGEGKYNLKINSRSIIFITSVGFLPKQSKVEGSGELNFALQIAPQDIQTVEVVSTGYERIPQERITGSFSFVNNRMVNRRVGASALSRLEGIVPGLLFNRNTTSASNGEVDITVRGQSTLFANAQPLIVVDNFPYDGNINNINPNDIESISILKDAAAASIWGARSGNGVIVITTKKGRRNQKLQMEFNANMTLGEKTDIFYNPNFIAASDFINIEQELFRRGVYNTDLASNEGITTSPVIELMDKVKRGKLDSVTAYGIIDSWRGNDVRNDISKYYYRQSFAQQYAINLRGGGNNSDFFFSLGYDDKKDGRVRNNDDRFTLNSEYNFYPIKKLTLSVAVNYIQSEAEQNNTLSQLQVISRGTSKGSMYPYARLTDDNGKNATVLRNLSDAYTDTVGGGGLNWKYNPLNELAIADNSTKATDTRVKFGVRYQIVNSLSAEVIYQNQRASTVNRIYYSDSSYYARNLINSFTQFKPGNVLSYPVPRGGILQQFLGDLSSNRLRAQLSFNRNFEHQHVVTAILGSELSDIVSSGNNNIAYGYNKKTGASTPAVDYLTTFPIIPSGSSQIPNPVGFSKTTDHFVSYYGNASYSYLGRYLLSVSGRIDKSNLFGVETNQKGVPLFSSGLGWIFSEEAFYGLDWLPMGKLRVTYGYNGNINKTVAAQTTLLQMPLPSGFYAQPYSMINALGNPELRWEKVKVFNIGLDFASKNQRLSGSVEVYNKKGVDLFGQSPLAPSTGNASFFGNTSSTSTKGVDVMLNSINVNTAAFKWSSSVLFSYVKDKVTDYDVVQKTNSYILQSTASSVVPLKGRPLFAIYSYRWAGLDPANGDPMGYLGKSTSKDYAAIFARTTTDSMMFHGAARPVVFGSLRNDLSYKGFSLSFNLIYKFRYYFRRSSMTYENMPWVAHKDFYSRWQKPGDEVVTNVPSLQYPPYNTNRELFYKLSSALVEKGDHIRFQDINLSYDFSSLIGTRVLSSLQVYAYVNNVGILWRANAVGLDPDLDMNSTGVYPVPRSYSLGVRANF
ncbi:SusC/RagA family TonB-linked outer membrane protein [uncultured Chitinophaga sp.]|uniref:SusC/RagA family TonB-linked outer membrane protein n=1 Tax=uncultured Chitinophaga sp. TaxID=339340 RepID=UPI0025D4A211|nr:SusC/RagA family TonB-linked outer membrane protein [uncultured Chitinophaga sp.]